MFGFLCYFVILQCMLFHVLQGNLSLKIPRIITVYSFDSLCSLVKLQLSSYSLVNCEVQRIWVALSFCFYSFHLLFFSTVMSPSNVAVLCLRNPSFFFFLFSESKDANGLNQLLCLLFSVRRFIVAIFMFYISCENKDRFVSLLCSFWRHGSLGTPYISLIQVLVPIILSV